MNTMIEDGSDTQPARARESVGDDMVAGSTWEPCPQSAAVWAVWFLVTFSVVTHLMTGLVDGSATFLDLATVAIWLPLGVFIHTHLLSSKGE